MKRVTQTVAAVLISAGPVWAQDAPAPAVPPIDRVELRHQIYVMEGALSRAVEYGAQKLNRQLRDVAPEMFLLAGNAEARGVYLDGYGIFFDVSVPMLRQSMMWSLRMMLQQDNSGTRNAIAELRSHVQTETDPAARQSLEAAVARLEAQVTPMASINRLDRPGPGVVTPSMVAQAAPTARGAAPAPTPAPAPGDMPWLLDTNRVYTEQVQRALIDAMLDFSAPMAIGNDEWLTVAARDNEQRDTLAPQDPYEEVVTVLMRIKGVDLKEYRAGRIDKLEARKRVAVIEF